MMLEKTKIKALKNIGNAIVAKSSQRNYPGVLIQGDTLRILLSDIEDIKEENLAGNNEAVQGIVDSLAERLGDLLVGYEQALKENNLEIPYVDFVEKNESTSNGIK